MSGLRLRSVVRDAAAFAEALLYVGARRVAIVPDDAFAGEIRQYLAGHGPAAPEEVGREVADFVCLTHAGRNDLEAELLFELDRNAGTLIIPELRGMGRDRPLFVISIPKAGTHLLLRLVEAFGFLPGIVCTDTPSNGHWYCIEFSNSHTVPRDFFVDTVRRSPFGNRAHPFLRAAALFIVRHPADILVSEANYYHRSGRAAFAGWLDGLAFEERITRLVDDDLLLGRFADRVRAFAPWLRFGNVATLTFEELVGDQGGGDPELQIRSIWSLQLKLGLTGAPDEFAAHIFDRESPTFTEGRIGAHRTAIGDGLRARIDRELSATYAAFGYSANELYSDAMENWRRRPLRIGGIDFGETPILVDPDFLDHGLVLFRGTYFGVPHGSGVSDLRALDPAALAALPQGAALDGLRVSLALEPLRVAIEAIRRGGGEPQDRVAAQLGALAQRISSLEVTMDERSHRLASLESNWDIAAANLARLVDTLAERTARVAALETALGELAERLRRLEETGGSVRNRKGVKAQSV